MLVDTEFLEESDCRPTFEQISQRRIDDEILKDLKTLKNLENILAGHSAGLSSYVNAVQAKFKRTDESILFPESSLNTALEMLFRYFEQASLLISLCISFNIHQMLKDIAETKMRLSSTDLLGEIHQLRQDAKSKSSEYQRDLAAAERDMHTAERRVVKAREHLEKFRETKAK